MEGDERFSKELENATAGVANLSFKSRSSHDEAGTMHCATPSSSLMNSDRARFNELVTQGKEKTRQGDLYGALGLYQKAYKIHESKKLAQKIEKLKEFIQENEEEEEEEEEYEEEDDGMIDVGNGFRLAANIYNALYPYQKDAILWFWGLYNQKKGGILGDDMGLGKTIQVISFLSGMFDAELIKSALIVMPVSVLDNWETEWKKWSPGIRVKAFHGSSKKERNRNLEKIQRKDGVCLTTYGMVVSNLDTLSEDWRGRDFKWDYIILDEGHKIKNTTKTSKNIRAIPAEHHFVLTGTPVQNNLREMWALFDFVCEGKLLGTSRTFKSEYENPIVRARERDASAYEKRIGNKMSESLRQLIEPHFLRRTKAMVLEKGNKVKQENVCETGEDESDSTFKMPTRLTRKNDLIVWLYMSKTQIQIYRDFLGLERVKEILMTTRSPLVELNVLKKITDHPRLLSANACSQLGLNEQGSTFGVDEDKENIDFSQDRSFVHEQEEAGQSDSTLIKESGKMLFLVTLLDNLKAEGHRCLVFSQSRKMLDIIQRVIKHRGHKVLRIDGTITKTAERQHLITTFQKDPSFSCFLLTTQVGGVGITLTGADRVVIFDPSWNPATDAQAVDRVYRIGQRRTVVIYRLITCGSIEEKIYRKQVFKDALMKQTTGCSKNPFRYFTRQDLRDLFTLDDPKRSATQLQLERMHAHNRKTDELLDKHIQFLHTLNIFGISDHDLMYSQEAVITEDEMAESGSLDAIHARVLRAQNMVAAESGNVGMRPPTGFELPKHPKAINQQEPTQTTVNGPIDWARIRAREKVQAALHEFQMFKPKREDNMRFVLSSGTRRSDPEVAKPEVRAEVIDLSTPPVTPLESNPTHSRTQPTLSSDNFVDLVELEDRPNEIQLERSFSSLKLDEPDARENQSCDNSVHSIEEVSDKAVDRCDLSYGSNSEYHDAVEELSSNSSRGEGRTLASHTVDVNRATPEVNGDAVSIVLGNKNTSGESTVADTDSEYGEKFVPKTDTACSPIFNNSLGKQSSLALESETEDTGSESLNDIEDDANETGFSNGSLPDNNERKEIVAFDSEEESEEDSERNNEDISPETSPFGHMKNRRRRIISIDAEEENDTSCEGTNSSAEKQYSFEEDREFQQPISNNNTREEIDNDSDFANGSTSHEEIPSPQHLQNIHSDSDGELENCDNSYQLSVSNEDRSGVEDETADGKELGDVIEETNSPQLHHASSIELETQSKTTFQKDESIAIANHLPHHRESVDDEIVFVPQSVRNRHRVKRMIVSDDEDDNDDDQKEIEVKAVNDRRKSASRRRSQIVYPCSSSDESDSENLESVEESEAMVAEVESGRDDESSDRSDSVNQSQPEVFDSEENNSNQATSMDSTSQDQLSYTENSDKGDCSPASEDQEMFSNSRSPQANRRRTDSRCPTGKHTSDVVNVNRCPCVTTTEERARYKEYLIKGRKLEEEGRGEDALWQYLAAVEVQDSDVRLHKKILVLQKKLEL